MSLDRLRNIIFETLKHPPHDDHSSCSCGCGGTCGKGKINEDYASKLYVITGYLVSDSSKKTQSQIYSDIRSLTGVTTIDSTEYKPKVPKKGYLYNKIEVKIDPYPYVKQKDSKFTIENVKNIIKNISNIRGVITFKAEPEFKNIGV